MRVKVVTTGELVNVPNNPTVQLMIKTGQIEPVQEQGPAARPAATPYAPPKTPSKWSIQEEYRTGNYVICWACPGCNQGGRFPGAKPDKVHLLRAWHCGHEGGEIVPPEIAARYMVINKPASAPFYEPKQPAPELTQVNVRFVDGKQISGDPLPAAMAREEAEKMRAPISDGPSFADALSKYEAALAEAANLAGKES